MSNTRVTAETAVVNISDHPNTHQASIEGFLLPAHAELHAARQAIKTAAREKYVRIIIRTDSLFAYEQIKNSANFARAPDEIRHLVASIHAIRNQIIVNAEHNEVATGKSDGQEIFRNNEEKL
ncbi:hypothetical protein GCK72_013198 [Caenorhabditis remanei]|uniref:Uncharacterized protein n=1 Tax=Caenorhabditis remanei TaxID=31234 RepID=A0A6A5GQ40_CAERE|nr:hypothetical protein GCK72_013198 [Caenorhabditis remanei]KAF1756744.1 hypothetical protein GCK72_013198 [Caenorhabditis remanei]